MALAARISVVCRVDTQENVVLSNKRALVDTQFGDTAGMFDALNLDAVLARAKPGGTRDACSCRQ
jgi:hypothetical protein